MSHILMQAFICNTYSDFHMEKIASFKYAKFQEQYVELPKILVYWYKFSSFCFWWIDFKNFILQICWRFWKTETG